MVDGNLGNNSDTGGLASRLASVEAKIPVPGTGMPVPIKDASEKGSSERYAREDHTHQSTVRSKRIQVTGSAGLAAWTFEDLGFVPIVGVTAETPSGAAYVNVASIIEGSTTATGVQIYVARIPKSITLPSVALSLLGLVLGLFSNAPAAVYVNCIARKPSV